MPRAGRHVGIGSKIDVLGKFLHPRKAVKELYGAHTYARKRVTDLNVIAVGEKLINRVMQRVWILSHVDFDDQELYCCQGHARAHTPAIPPSARDVTQQNNRNNSSVATTTSASMSSSSSSQGQQPAFPHSLIPRSEAHAADSTLCKKAKTCTTNAATISTTSDDDDESDCESHDEYPEQDRLDGEDGDSADEVEVDLIDRPFFDELEEQEMEEDMTPANDVADEDDDEDEGNVAQAVPTAEDVDCKSDDEEPDDRGPINFKGFRYKPWNSATSSTSTSSAPRAHKPRLINAQPYIRKFDGLFYQMLPLQFIVDEVIPATNKAIGDHNRIIAAQNETGHMRRRPRVKDLTFGELLRFLGLLFCMSLHPAYTRSDFWNITRKRTMMYTPPFLGHYMSQNRFNDIISFLRIADSSRAPTAYEDPFWEIRGLQDAFNNNMRDSFRPSTFVCLGESMVVWTNERGPGLMYVGRKPHPEGNEYHTIACKETAVIFKIELVEGRHRPEQLPPLAYSTEHKQKTVALVLRMTEDIHGTGRVVAMDSGFGVLNGIVELLKKGTFATIVLKKHGRYWPRGCPGGNAKALLRKAPPGTLLIKEEVEKGFFLLAYREAKFTSITAHTYGDESLCDRRRYRRDDKNQRHILRYPKVLDEYYQTRHAVDDNNHHRMAYNSFETGWRTRSWATRQFAFIVALCETNAFLLYNYLANEPPTHKRLTHQEYRMLLGDALLENCWLAPEGTTETRNKPKRRHSKSSSLLASAPHVEQRAPDYSGRWDPKTKSFVTVRDRYQKRRCSIQGCKKASRLYCKCNPARCFCREHLTEHIASFSIDSSPSSSSSSSDM